jgi:DNA-binding transcriptional ArsR family regulator
VIASSILLCGVSSTKRAIERSSGISTLVLTLTRILYALIGRPLCVRDLAILVGVSESGVSHQLRFLRERRLVKTRREGNVIYYTVDDHHVAALFKEADYHIDHVRQGLPDHPYPASNEQ